MSAWCESSRITVIPTGVDLTEYKPDFSGRHLAPVVMFVGAMDWEPNVDGVEFFCSEIWPAILKQIPGAKLRVVGRNPVRRVAQRACDTVEVTGRVPAVIDQLRQAAVVIVPLRIGGGTRLKIYEAMGAGKAVVSTSVGAEGLDVHHGREIILADGAREFADAVVMLLRDPEARRRYEQAAAETAARYDWATVAAQFEAVLGSVARHAPCQPDMEIANAQVDLGIR
jgi:glycosyltransferase involved in cell wall biosynthesis